MTHSPFLARGLQVDGYSRVHGCELENPGAPSCSWKLVTVYEAPGRNSREYLQLSCHTLDHVVAFTCLLGRRTKVAQATTAHHHGFR